MGVDADLADKDVDVAVEASMIGSKQKLGDRSKSYRGPPLQARTEQPIPKVTAHHKSAR